MSAQSVAAQARAEELGRSPAGLVDLRDQRPQCAGRPCLAWWMASIIRWYSGSTNS